MLYFNILRVDNDLVCNLNFLFLVSHIAVVVFTYPFSCGLYDLLHGITYCVKCFDCLNYCQIVAFGICTCRMDIVIFRVLIVTGKELGLLCCTVNCIIITELCKL